MKRASLALLIVGVLASFGMSAGGIQSNSPPSNVTNISGVTGDTTITNSVSTTRNGSHLGAGTVPNSALATDPTNASNISSGTLNQGRLPATLPDETAGGTNGTLNNFSINGALNVMAPQFGAECDGVTDDTVAIQAAITAATHGGSIGGTDVLIPGGHICVVADHLLVTSTTNANANVRIRGAVETVGSTTDGSVLKFTGTPGGANIPPTGVAITASSCTDTSSVATCAVPALLAAFTTAGSFTGHVTGNSVSGYNTTSPVGVTVTVNSSTSISFPVAAGLGTGGGGYVIPLTAGIQMVSTSTHRAGGITLEKLNIATSNTGLGGLIQAVGVSGGAQASGIQILNNNIHTLQSLGVNQVTVGISLFNVTTTDILANHFDGIADQKVIMGGGVTTVNIRRNHGDTTGFNNGSGMYEVDLACDANSSCESVDISDNSFEVGPWFVHIGGGTGTTSIPQGIKVANNYLGDGTGDGTAILVNQCSGCVVDGNMVGNTAASCSNQRVIFTSGVNNLSFTNNKVQGACTDNDMVFSSATNVRMDSNAIVSGAGIDGIRFSSGSVTASNNNFLQSGANTKSYSIASGARADIIYDPNLDATPSKFLDSNNGSAGYTMIHTRAAPTDACNSTCTAGHAYASQPERGATYKRAVAYLSAYQETGAAQTFTFPTAFLATPNVTQQGCANSGATAASATTTTLTLPAGAGMAAESCTIAVEGN